VTSPIDHPFQPGVEVAIVSRGFGGDVSYRNAIVAKVHKNGNFTLNDGANQQYRPWATAWANPRRWTARPTGEITSNPTIELLTDELQKQVDATNRRNEFRDLVKRLDRVQLSDVAQAQLEQLRALVDDITAVEKSAT
jgi:hypothetical protein